MDIIKEWVRSIFMVVIAISFIEILLPSGRLTNYIKFVFSVIMVAIIIEPLGGLNHTNQEEIPVFGGVITEQSALEDQSLVNKYMDYSIDVQSIYKEKIEEKVSQIITQSFAETKIKQVDATFVDGSIQKNGGGVYAIKIQLDDSKNATEIKQALAKEMGIAQSKIIITD